jgi:leucyl-tRNA synthetase
LAGKGEADAGKLDRQVAGLAVPVQAVRCSDDIEVYSTRPDTLFGASFVAIAADHPVAQALAKQSPEVAGFIAKCKQGGTTAAELETAEKLGFDTGLKCCIRLMMVGRCRSISPISC